MHELAITEEIVSIVSDEAKKAGAKRVSRVKVHVGVRTGFHPEIIQHYYEILKAGNELLEGSTLEASEIPTTLTCKDCKNVTTQNDFVLICPACGSTNTVAEGGKDVTIQSLEIEDGHENRGN